MPRNIYYAMEPSWLETYVTHKGDMQQASKLLTAEKIENIKAEVSGMRSGEAPKNYMVEDGVAKISISGILEPKADLCAVLFDIDMTTYSDIINSINLAENDNSVEKIVFEINSPGGNVVGLNRTAEKIKNASKPTVAIVTDMAASAAYWLASQTDQIIAEHSGVEIGSIGVFCQYVDLSGADKIQGIERKSFRSENAPLKNVDPFSIEGGKQIVARITKLESIFFDYIIGGRHTTLEDVKENYGKGAMLIAGEALETGMIDTIESIKKTSMPTQSKNINTKKEVDPMSEKIEMTEEQFNSAISKAANSAVEKALSAKASEDKKNAAAEKAETGRVAGFTGLIAGFPKQSELIKAEMAKGNFATSDFALKVSSAEETRVKVEQETKKNEEDIVPEIKPKEEDQGNSKLNAVANMCINGRVE